MRRRVWAPAPCHFDEGRDRAAGARQRRFDDRIAYWRTGDFSDHSAAIPADGARHDSAVIPRGAKDGLTFTTDSFVVQATVRFPGGDIGSLAVHGYGE